MEEPELQYSSQRNRRIFTFSIRVSKRGYPYSRWNKHRGGFHEQTYGNQRKAAWFFGSPNPWGRLYAGYSHMGSRNLVLNWPSDTPGLKDRTATHRQKVMKQH